MNYKEKYFKAKGLDKCDVIFCAVCGKVATQLHHVEYKSRCGKDNPENLLPVCSECHASHHNNNNPTTEQLKALL